jgi:hypothetical protein
MDPPGRNIRSDTNYSKWPQQGQAAHILHDSRPDAPTRSENERPCASMKWMMSLGIIQPIRLPKRRVPPITQLRT